jgi:hypothetical protein
MRASAREFRVVACKTYVTRVSLKYRIAREEFMPEKLQSISEKSTFVDTWVRTRRPWTCWAGLRAWQRTGIPGEISKRLAWRQL